MDWTPPGVAACRSHPGESDQSGGGGFRPGTPRPACHANPALALRHFDAFASRWVRGHDLAYVHVPVEILLTKCRPRAPHALKTK